MINSMKKIAKATLVAVVAVVAGYGIMVPSPYVIADFFDQLIPIINQYAGERKARIAEKYGPNRQTRRRNKKKRRQQS